MSRLISCVTSLCRTLSPSGLASELIEEVLEMEERRLLQSEAWGERQGDWEEDEEDEGQDMSEDVRSLSSDHCCLNTTSKSSVTIHQKWN